MWDVCGTTGMAISSSGIPPTTREYTSQSPVLGPRRGLTWCVHHLRDSEAVAIRIGRLGNFMASVRFSLPQ